MRSLCHWGALKDTTGDESGLCLLLACVSLEFLECILTRRIHCVFVRVRVCLCACVWVYVCITYVYMYVCIYIYIYIYTYIHIGCGESLEYGLKIAELNKVIAEKDKYISRLSEQAKAQIQVSVYTLYSVSFDTILFGLF